MSHSVSVLIAAYNESPTVESMMAQVCAQSMVTEIVVVDDGSTDGTREILSRLATEDQRIRFVCHETNRGKGAAIRTAIEHASGSICIIQDADLEYDPADYAALIAPIVSGDTRVVYGSRALNKDNEYPFDIFRVGSFVVTWTANILYGCLLTDEPTCYKVFDTDLLKSLPLNCTGFEFCPEVTAKVRKRGVKIIEVPITYDKRTVEEGKKINWKDGVIALWTLVKYRVTD